MGQVAGPIELPTGFSILYLAEKRQVLTADPRDAKLSASPGQRSTSRPAPPKRRARKCAGEFAEATKGIKGCGDAAGVAGAERRSGRQ
jgi:peptidyl-prolyl cis-trans isomerase SurA